MVLRFGEARETEEEEEEAMGCSRGRGQRTPAATAGDTGTAPAGQAPDPLMIAHMYGEKDEGERERRRKLERVLMMKGGGRRVRSKGGRAETAPTPDLGAVGREHPAALVACLALMIGVLDSWRDQEHY